MGHNENQANVKLMIIHLNLCSLDDRYTVAKILTGRYYKLVHSNNGAYIMVKDLDSAIIHDVFCCIQVKFK